MQGDPATGFFPPPFVPHETLGAFFLAFRVRVSNAARMNDSEKDVPGPISLAALLMTIVLALFLWGLILRFCGVI